VAGLVVVLAACWVSIVIFPVGGTTRLAPGAAAASPTTSSSAATTTTTTTTTTSTSSPSLLRVLGTSPAAGATAMSSSGDITVQFSAPLPVRYPSPTLSPDVPGTWEHNGSMTLVFHPSANFLPLSKVVLTVPAGRLEAEGGFGRWLATGYVATFTVAPVPELRLQQLLAELGYLPLRFDPSAARTSRLAGFAPQLTRRPVPAPPARPAPTGSESGTADTVSLAVQPGSFSWRYLHVPASLATLWQPGVDTALTEGAVMAFQSDHGLYDDGQVTSGFWAALIRAVESRQLDTAPYGYLEVSTALPETLSVWRDGTVIYRTPVNTGIPVAPTAPGTYPVYARYLSTTMSGYNPDGSHYEDPGIPDVAYFNGGDAVHGFLRASYGFPQSLGCVELAYSAAAIVFNYDPIGTLVTVS
jgi:peptidoglycan hydrolase-like protein with peptidoglycan-binding domain